MRKLSILLVILTALIPISALADADFEKANFGMSRAEVIAAHPDVNFSDTGSELWYGTMEALSGAATVFSFNEQGKFSVGSYLIYDTLDKSDYVLEQFLSIKEMATSKYGTPVLDEELWSDETLKSLPSAYGAAVSAGHLEYNVYYVDKDTIITLNLQGKNYGPQFIMTYIDNSK